MDAHKLTRQGLRKSRGCADTVRKNGVVTTDVKSLGKSERRKLRRAERSGGPTRAAVTRALYPLVELRECTLGALKRIIGGEVAAQL